MKRIFFILIYLYALSVYSQNNLNVAGYSPVAYEFDYQAPCFLNSNRVQKIEAAFPVVEKLFKEYYNDQKKGSYKQNSLEVDIDHYLDLLPLKQKHQTHL